MTKSPTTKRSGASSSTDDGALSGRLPIEADHPAKQRRESRLLKNLVANLIADLNSSGLNKPAFAEKIGISGSQFRYLRSGAANPSMRMLATIAERSQKPFYELLENHPLEGRRNPNCDEMNKAFSAIVKARYAESGLSHTEFAKLLGVSVPQLYLILRGLSNPSFLMVEEIARRLVIDLWLMLGVEARPGPSRRKRRKIDA